MTDRGAAPRLTGDDRVHVAVLGGFRLSLGLDPAVEVPRAAQRLLAYLAFRSRPTARNVAAASLWPDASEVHAAGNLRSALARLGVPCRRAISVSSVELALADEAAVDVWAARELAHRLLDPTVEVGRLDVRSASIDQLSGDVLPGWYDDWALVAAEDWRQLRLHALEALTERFAEERRFADAVYAAQAAIRVDPLRESPHGALIRVHLAEGNQNEALAQFTRYRELLRGELGIEPTARLCHLVAGLGAGGARTR